MGTEQDMAQQQRLLEREQREQEQRDAARYIMRTLAEKLWPQSDVDEVMGALGLDTLAPPL